MSSAPIGSSSADDPTLRVRLAELTKGYSLEVTPGELLRHIGKFSTFLSPGTSVYITALPKAPFDDTLAAAAAVAAAGFVPVPHVTARSLQSLKTLDGIAAQLGDLGVTQILAVAGSASRPAGDIEESMQILSSGILQRHGITDVGVAGHPEGSPDIAPEECARALRLKNEVARETGLRLHLLTQFVFDGEPVVAWERRIREEGNQLPVTVGLPGLSTPAKLIKFGLACGVGASLTVLRKQVGGVLKLATASTYHPDRTMVQLAKATLDEPATLITGVHFFPFGAVEPTVTWADRVATGAFHPRGESFVVD